MRIDSLCVSEKKETGSGTPHVLPIHASSAFTYSDIDDSIDVFTGEKQGFVYSRYGNPTISTVEEKLAAMEALGTDHDAFALLTSSGMSAISTLLGTLLNPGDTLITQFSLYGGTTELIKKILEPVGVKVVYCNLNDVDELEKCIENQTTAKLIYFESPTNPTLECVDISQLVGIAKKNGISTAIDNTFCTAYLQKPMLLGVDYVVYSTTKFLNGHGNSIAGAVITKSLDKKKELWNHMKLSGTNCNAFDAWLLHNGIKTLAVRMDRHCSNALGLAQHLNNHSKVKTVNYPGLENDRYHNIASKQMSQYGAMLSFELDGDISIAKKFMNACKLCSITSTLGNVDTLLLHPATSSHLNVDRALRLEHGISDGLIRVSVGIENLEDILEDINKAIDIAYA